jgi:hypothetical protein
MQNALQEPFKQVVSDAPSVYGTYSPAFPGKELPEDGPTPLDFFLAEIP